MNDEPDASAKTLARVLAERAPLVVLGVLVMIVAASGTVPYTRLSLASYWRYSLFVVGILLAAVGIVFLWRSPTIKRRSLSINLQPIVGRHDPPLELDYRKLTNVSDLLDKVWYSITPRVEEGTYGKAWVLLNVDNGHMYREMGNAWAREHGRDKDDRVLDEVDIRPGMKLAVVRPKEQPPQQAPRRLAVNWRVTNDWNVDDVHDKLNNLDLPKDGSDAELWKVLRCLFNRPMYTHIREEGFDTELFALCRTRLILQRYINSFANVRTQEKIQYLTTRVIKLYQGIADLYGSAFIRASEEYCSQSSTREAYVQRLPQHGQPGEGFEQQMSSTLQQIRTTVQEINLLCP